MQLQSMKRPVEMPQSDRCSIKLNQRIYGLYGTQGLKVLKNLLNSLMKHLRVHVLEYFIESDGWVRVSFEGEDLEAALNILSTVIGILPETYLDVSKGRMLKCRVLTLKENGLYVDAGLKNITITVPATILKSQVFDGCDMPVEKLERLYMFYRDFPVELYVRDVHKNEVICALSWRWLNWADKIVFSGLGRIYVAGVDLDTVESFINRKPYRDYVLDCIHLGVLEALLLIDPLVNPYDLSNNIGRILKPSVLMSSKPFKGFRKLSYTFQDEVWFNTAPPFQIP